MKRRQFIKQTATLSGAALLTYQMNAFALNIIQNTTSIVSGNMGLRDMRIIDKIYKSVNNNGEVIYLKDVPEILDLKRWR